MFSSVSHNVSRRGLLSGIAMMVFTDHNLFTSGMLLRGGKRCRSDSDPEGDSMDGNDGTSKLRSGKRFRRESDAFYKILFTEFTHGAKGTFTFTDGSVYEGDLDPNNLHISANGNGKLAWPNGDIYEGHFQNGLIHGKGKFTWANGDIYQGQYKDAQRHGWGKLSWANGDVYEGQYQDDQWNGNGKLTLDNGDVYEGQFENGQKHGNGKFTWADGDVYEKFQIWRTKLSAAYISPGGGCVGKKDSVGRVELAFGCLIYFSAR